MALRVVDMALRSQLASRLPRTSQVGSVTSVHTLDKIGKREIVGYGWNGTACYVDRVDYPIPPVRFHEPNNEINALREKEKQDWKKISVQEKKWRNGEWKMHVGMGLLFTSIALWMFIFMNFYVYDELPATFDEEHQKAQLKRMLDLEMNPVIGISSKWVYGNGKENENGRTKWIIFVNDIVTSIIHLS